MPLNKEHARLEAEKHVSLESYKKIGHYEFLISFALRARDACACRRPRIGAYF